MIYITWKISAQIIYVIAANSQDISKKLHRIGKLFLRVPTTCFFILVRKKTIPKSIPQNLKFKWNDMRLNSDILKRTRGTDTPNCSPTPFQPYKPLYRLHTRILFVQISHLYARYYPTTVRT